MYTNNKPILFALSLLLVCGSPTTAATTLGISAGQYRIQDDYQSSYWMQNVSAYVKTKHWKAKLSMPFLQQDNGRYGTGNGLLKLSWLNQIGGVYTDIHLRQRLATAYEDITLPVADRAASIEFSKRFGRTTVGFAETGYWWREKTKYDRKNTFFTSLGGIRIVSKQWLMGGVFDHRPTAYGEIDRTASLLTQYRASKQHKFTLTTGKGLQADSPDWIIGIQWQYKTRL